MSQKTLGSSSKALSFLRNLVLDSVSYSQAWPVFLISFRLYTLILFSTLQVTSAEVEFSLISFSSTQPLIFSKGTSLSVSPCSKIIGLILFLRCYLISKGTNKARSIATVLAFIQEQLLSSSNMQMPFSTTSIEPSKVPSFFSDANNSLRQSCPSPWLNCPMQQNLIEMSYYWHLREKYNSENLSQTSMKYFSTLPASTLTLRLLLKFWLQQGLMVALAAAKTLLFLTISSIHSNFSDRQLTNSSFPSFFRVSMKMEISSLSAYLTGLVIFFKLSITICDDPCFLSCWYSKQYLNAFRTSSLVWLGSSSIVSSAFSRDLISELQWVLCCKMFSSTWLLQRMST